MLIKNWPKYGDFFGRLGIISYFTYVATNLGKTVFDQIGRLFSGDAGVSLPSLASTMASLIFMTLVVATTLIRLKPLDAAQGIMPRFIALAGTFASVFMISFKPTFFSPVLQVLGFILTISGLILSAYVITWLGRSFSIMAEARRLVTSGPYSIVRHPLYVVEEIAFVGIVLLNLSLPAILIAIVQWALQLKRMRFEEEVLLRAFPEYAEYAKTTPRVIPTFLWPHPSKNPTEERTDAH